MDEIIKIPKKRYRFHIIAELIKIEKLDKDLPKNEVRKYISTGGFSSIGFVKFIADRTFIKKLTVSTLRVGRKHLQVLDVLKNQGKLDKVNFIVGSIMKNDSTVGKSYKYYDDLVKVCKKNNWNIFVNNNHSKILLFDTKDGKFVIETSSNLNENPNAEQFSFEKNEELYNFYFDYFKKLGGVVIET
ncbi:MAG: hypothetical protein ACI4HO_02180 [Ruminococcus sp.]